MSMKATGAVKAIVLQANYNSNSADNLIDFECLVPVKAGEMEKSRYDWPSTLRVDETWPPQEDIDSGDAGGGGIGQGATGELPIGYIDGIESGGIVWVGGPNVAFNRTVTTASRSSTVPFGSKSQSSLSARMTKPASCFSAVTTCRTTLSRSCSGSGDGST
jgi:hypothetical protein